MLPLLIIGVAQGLFAAAYFQFKSTKSPTDKLVAVFLFALTIPLGIKLCNFFFTADGVVVSAIYHAIPFSYAPILYLYMDLTVAETPRFRMRSLAHFIAPVAVLAVFLLFPGGFSNELSRVRPPPFPEAPPLPGPRGNALGGFGWLPANPRLLPTFFVYGSLAILSLAYVALILRSLRRHRQRLGDYFSSGFERRSLVWLEGITLAFILLSAFIIVFTSVLPLFTRLRSIPPGIADAYGWTFFIFVFSMFSLKQAPVYATPDPAWTGEGGTPATAPVAEPDPRYERSSLKAGDARQILDKLEAYMGRERAYQDCELTIFALARALSVKRHHLTQVLNETLHVNFYTYINRLRVAEAVRLMEDEPDASLLDIAFRAGFQSKSTFNRVFKNYTGKVPSEYRASP